MTNVDFIGFNVDTKQLSSTESGMPDTSVLFKFVLVDVKRSNFALQILDFFSETSILGLQIFDDHILYI